MGGRAYSIDGRSFSFDAPLLGAVPIGAYVTISVPDGETYLGQVLDESVVHTPDDTGTAQSFVQGRGTLLAALDSDGSRAAAESGVFGAGELDIADPGLVADHLAAARSATAGIELGELQRPSGAPAVLHASGFGRHTFLCGQSGSGKTYTLGLILEQLLLETDIRLALLDPNSDYVNLRNLRPQAQTGLDDEGYAALVERYGAIARGIHVFGGEGASERLRVEFSRLTFEQQTMALGLDPIAHPEMYNAFVRLTKGLESDSYGIGDIVAATRSSFANDVRRLGLRIDNLGVADLSIWARPDEPAIADVMPPDWRMAIVDLGQLDSRRETSIAAAAILGILWEQRRARRPTLVVIDEAHNVCPQNPVGPNQALATEHVVRIAGEGRKYGLYLLLATQRPEKVHQNVLSQCDNLVLMRMNSASDIAALGQMFGFAPPALMNQASGFGLGEGLAAGRIAPEPLLFKSGRRYTLEGGSDVPSSWAQPG